MALNWRRFCKGWRTILKFVFAAVALLAVALLAACTEDGAPTSAPPQATPTETPTLTPTEDTPAPTPQETPTPALQTYRNDKYEYEISYPEGWRLADQYMQKFAELTSNPRFTAVPEDYVVFTSLSEIEEDAFIGEASQRPGGFTGLEPWLEFVLRTSVAIFPIGTDQATYLMDIVDGNVIRTVTDVREVVLDSGQVASRLTRRDQDDRGDFTFDTVYVPFSFDLCPAPFDTCRGIIIRMATAGRTSLEDPLGQPPPENPGYSDEDFETIFRSFQDE